MSRGILAGNLDIVLGYIRPAQSPFRAVSVLVLRGSVIHDVYSRKRGHLWSGFGYIIYNDVPWCREPCHDGSAGWIGWTPGTSHYDQRQDPYIGFTPPFPDMYVFGFVKYIDFQ